MTFLAPGYLAVFGLALPILLLYILKLRRPEVRISSLFLWQQVIQDQAANTPWQRIRKNLLLILQLVFLGLISLALARPGIPTTTLARGSLIVLLDGSASMQAQDVKPDRFTAAKSAVRRLIQELEPNTSMTLILVNHQPQVLTTAEEDRDRLLALLDLTTVSDTQGDWVTAAALATGAAQNLGDGTTTVFITDGGTGEVALPPMPGKIRYIQIGESGENLAVSKLAVTMGDRDAQLFAQINNFGSRETTIIASIYRDAELIHASPLTIPPGGDQPVILEGLSPDPGVFEVHIEPMTGEGTFNNHLPLDDQRYFPFRPDPSRMGLLLTEGNFFLEQLLGAFENYTFLKAFREEDISQLLSDNRYDLFIFDGLLPTPFPTGNLLLINPPSNDLFSVGLEPVQLSQPIRISESSLAGHLSWEGIHLRETQLIQLPFWANSLVSSGDIPLVFTGETDGRRIAVIAFDLLDSDFPLNTSFPILMANLLDFLIPTYQLGLPAQVGPGTILTQLSNPAYENTLLTTPSQVEIPVSPGLNFLEELTLSEVGIYAIKTTIDQVDYTAQIGVNLLDSQESDIHPANELLIGQTITAAQPLSETKTREVWPLLVVAGFIALLAEWWLSQYGNMEPLPLESPLTSRPNLFERLPKTIREVIVPHRSRISARRRQNK